MVLGALTVSGAAIPFCAAADTSQEYQIKAVLLLNLCRFVDWPPTAFPNPTAPIVIGIVGHDPFGKALDQTVADEQVSGRKIVIERFSRPESVKPCQVLFIGSSDPSRVRDIVQSQKTKPVLTVSEVAGFTTRCDGMVRLYLSDQKKVRLEVNLQTVKAGDLKLSSKLLQVAQITRS